MSTTDKLFWGIYESGIDSQKAISFFDNLCTKLKRKLWEFWTMPQYIEAKSLSKESSISIARIYGFTFYLLIHRN